MKSQMMLLDYSATFDGKASQVTLDQRWAELSECERYRYLLGRAWAAEGPRVLFVMLNPSTATAIPGPRGDDPTIRKCIGFAKRWGMASLEVVNLFAFRSTDANELLRRPHHEIIGPKNADYMRAAIERASRVVVAWGTHKAARDPAVASALWHIKDAGKKAWRIGDPTADGHPSHPLMLAYARQLQEHAP